MLGLSTRFWGLAALAAAAAATALAVPGDARACGCFNPPEPVSPDQDYAVNQQAEQIIFEVQEDDVIDAHVLIRYQGQPESFAWLLPVPYDDSRPEYPQFELSESVGFGLLDQASQPQVSVSRPNLCPDPEFVCERHDFPTCDTGGGGGADGGGAARDAGVGFDDASTGAGGDPDGVDVIGREVVGSYDVVTFSATDAMDAVDWLNTEGFIVNDTMTPYMQPYLDMGMAVVAAKLLPDAGVEEIRPLKVTYAADMPMIPLQLTAIAADPELTVTAYVYGTEPFEPVDKPVIAMRDEWIADDNAGRLNYPMALSRAVDEAGGDGWVIEYAGAPPVPTFGGTSGCCDGGFDRCGVGGNGTCECPGTDFDAADCSMEEGLVEGIELVERLATDHAYMTRLTTRLGPHEMDYDPSFQPMMDVEPPVARNLRLTGDRKQMDACVDDIVDDSLYDAVESLQDCASVYCGQGECAATDAGAGCICDPGYVARQFTDLDGEPSVTCVPDTEIVDFGADGLALQDSCGGVSCGAGSCVDLGGFPHCECSPGNAAVVDPDSATGSPSCVSVDDRAGSPGGHDLTDRLEDVRACAPAPPTDCGEWGWLVDNPDIDRKGVLCPSSLPSDESRFEVPPEPTCEDLEDRFPRGDAGAVDRPGTGGGDPSGGGGCAVTRSGAADAGGVAFALLLGGVTGLSLRRRRRRSRR